MAVRDEEHRLFSSNHLSDLLNARITNALASVGKTDANELLQRPPNRTVDSLFEQFRILATRLKTDEMTGEVGEDVVDVRGDFRRAIVDNGHPVNVPAARIEYQIPFTGPNIFDFRPSRFTLHPPRGQILSNVLVVSSLIPSDVLTEQRQPCVDSLRREISKIEEYLSWIATDLEAWEPELRGAIARSVERRRAELLAMRDTEAMLGVPIVRDEALANTYSVPVPQRRPPPRPRRQRTYGTFKPEPAISDEDFTSIVTDIGSVLAGFERFAITHERASEEQLRDQIVVFLNAIYGGGSAESFSKRGKTDIYLPWESSAVFLAECKWWAGERAFRDKCLPQLLDRYIVWRDTHTAVVLFIKNKDVSAVISKAVESIREHPRYVNDASQVDGFRTFILHQDGDEERQLRLALLTAAITP